MKKIILFLAALFVLVTAVPSPTVAGNVHTLEYNLQNKMSLQFDCCGGMFGLLFGYRNYSGYREFGFYDTDGDWHCIWIDGYGC